MAQLAVAWVLAEPQRLLGDRRRQPSRAGHRERQGGRGDARATTHEEAIDEILGDVAERESGQDPVAGTLSARRLTRRPSEREHHRPVSSRTSPTTTATGHRRADPSPSRATPTAAGTNVCSDDQRPGGGERRRRSACRASRARTPPGRTPGRPAPRPPPKRDRRAATPAPRSPSRRSPSRRADPRTGPARGRRTREAAPRAATPIHSATTKRSRSRPPGLAGAEREQHQPGVTTPTASQTGAAATLSTVARRAGGHREVTSRPGLGEVEGQQPDRHGVQRRSPRGRRRRRPASCGRRGPSGPRSGAARRACSRTGGRPVPGSTAATPKTAADRDLVRLRETSCPWRLGHRGVIGGSSVVLGEVLDRS